MWDNTNHNRSPAEDATKVDDDRKS